LGSAREFLRELMALAGQESASEVPMLELQIGEVVSNTTVETTGKVEYLVITAWLPASNQSSYLPARADQFADGEVPPRAATILWNDERQRYVAVRRVPVRELHTERSALDAILQTVDEAIGWLALLEKLHL
jgi:hypothetical protein